MTILKRNYVKCILIEVQRTKGAQRRRRMESRGMVW